MKAVVLSQKGNAERALQIQEVPTPSPKKRQVRIKVEAFGLNYADVMARLGLYDAAPKMPCIVGYEVVGVIDEVGEDTDKSLIGKRVVAFTRFGGYAEYAVTGEDAFAEIGDMDAGEACAIAVQYATAYYMVCDALHLHKGDKVLIHAGAGGVGTALIQLCKLQGCEIFANAGSDEKLEYMKEQGAHHVINYRKEAYEEVIRKMTGEKSLMATFNPIAGSTFKKDMKLLSSGGKLILFGGSERSGMKWGALSSLNFVRKMGLIIPIGLVMSSKAVIGVNMLNIGDEQPQVLKRCMDEVVDLVKAGKLKPTVGASFKAKEIAKAHSLLESRNSIGKIVVYWESN
jgi:NADPH:quinone reductase-like Zn-dependent oxidoreductase